MKTKTCGMCRNVLAFDQFPPDKKTPTGRGGHCYTCRRIVQKRYRDKKGKAALSEYYRAYYEAHKARWRERGERWMKANPEYRRAKQCRREARIRNAPYTLTAAEWNAILVLAEHRCVYCASYDRITMDHVIPLSKGGGTTKENVVPACLSCNSSKGDKDIAVIRPA